MTELAFDVAIDLAFASMRAHGPPATATTNGDGDGDGDPPDPPASPAGAMPAGDWLDGPTVSAFVEGRLARNGHAAGTLDPTTARVLSTWRHEGRKAHVAAVDRIVVEIGAHLGELPASAYVARRATPTRAPTAGAPDVDPTRWPLLATL